MSSRLHLTRKIGAASELLVAYRFMEAGRLVSWPLIPTSYDLLVDCGDVIQRVQVKTGQDRNATGVYHVHLTKRRAKGDRPIYLASVDYICVVCAANHVYVIPAIVLQSPTDPAVLCKRLQIYTKVEAERFHRYRNAFAIGQGHGTVEGPQAEVHVAPLRTSWHPEQQRAGRHRKPHVRLSTDVILQLRRTLGATPTTTAIREAALHHGVAEVTLRNYLQGKRKDLQPLGADELTADVAVSIVGADDNR